MGIFKNLFKKKGVVEYERPISYFLMSACPSAHIAVKEVAMITSNVENNFILSP